MSDTTKKIKIDKIEYGHIQSKLHNGPITKLEISPNEKYLVTYSQFDRSIVGWNVVEDINEGKLEPDYKIDFIISKGIIEQICVSDDKKLAYIFEKRLEIIDICNNKEVELNLKFDACYYTFNFNLKGELILYDDVRNRIYSIQIKNSKCMCKRIYEISKDFQFISISKDDKLYFASNDSIYECNIFTGKSIRIFYNDENNKYNKLMINISSNERFTCLKIKDKIIIYSIELDIPIASLDINNDTQLYNFMKLTGSSNLLLPLLNNSEIWNSIMKHYWEKRLKHSEQNNELSKEYRTESLPNQIQITNEYAFRVINGYVWKIKLENSDEILENLNKYFNNNNNIVKESYETYERLAIHLFNSHINIKYEDISTEKFKFKEENQEPIELSQNLIKWNIKINYKNTELQVYKKIDVDNEWSLICEKRIDEFNICYTPKLLSDNYIFILTTFGIFIYHFDEVKKSIFLSYFYNMNLDKYDDTEKLQFHYEKVFSTPTLPLPNYDSFKLNDSWVSYIIDNKENLLKYGAELLSFAIKEHKSELIDKIYNKSIIYFKEDVRNNRMFLSIFSCMMPLLNEYYPEYISKYLLETNLIVDSPFYTITYNLHLHSFQYFQIFDLTLWSEYQNNKKVNYILNTIQQLACHIYKFSTNITKPTKPTITFMIPYIKFVSYPQKYDWFLELIKPQPSPFIEAINENFYKTWNGEALINFKWNIYGRYYYMIIWIMFMTLFGCFTIVATIPQLYNNGFIRIQLLINSIILGFIHLSFEIRQMIYNPIKWIYDFWNKIGIIAYLLPIYTSIYWLIINDRNDHIIRLLTFSCLFLNIKFLLFFRVFESFSFANSFYILLPLNIKTIKYINLTSIFTIYKIIKGDLSEFLEFAYFEPSFIILVVLFSLLIIIYLMNLFIELLNMAINKDNDRVSYLVQKAEILAEIELFYLLPNQRRWKSWFPEVMHYHANINKTREKVKELISKGELNIKEFPKLKEDLLIKLNLQPVDEVSLRRLLEEIQKMQSNQ
ncbi:hypothetical protein RhiirB3_434827 [Rhizophagus irregularis]|nr:hypothetical protein RhiirB3_434827 [Rhizophagus irregularis]